MVAKTVIASVAAGLMLGTAATIAYSKMNEGGSKLLRNSKKAVAKYRRNIGM